MRPTGNNQSWVAGVPLSSSSTSLAGRMSRLGGTLQLRDDALVFKPLAGLGRTRRFPLADVALVDAFADRPPRLRINLRGGAAMVLLVTPSRISGVWTRDTSLRDEAVATINARLRNDH